MSSDETVFHVILALLALCIFMSNLVVLMAIIKAEHLHTPSNMFVAGMALADASVAMIGLPLRFVVSLNLNLSFYSCLVLNCVFLYSLDMSLYMLLGFTFDRLYAIRFPFKYHQQVDCKYAIIAIAVVWAIGMLVASIPSLMIEEREFEMYEGICSFSAVIPNVYLVFVSFLVIYLGTLFILAIVNIYIMCVVERHRRTIKHCTMPSIYSSVRKNHVRKKDVKSEKMLVVMITVFLICCLPLNMSVVTRYFGHPPDPIVFYILRMMYYLNSFLNPFIYAISNTRIKRACMNVILCRPLKKTMSASTLNSFTRSLRTSSIRSLGKIEESESDNRICKKGNSVVGIEALELELVTKPPQSDGLGHFLTHSSQVSSMIIRSYYSSRSHHCSSSSTTSRSHNSS